MGEVFAREKSRHVLSARSSREKKQGLFCGRGLVFPFGPFLEVIEVFLLRNLQIRPNWGLISEIGQIGG